MNIAWRNIRFKLSKNFKLDIMRNSDLDGEEGYGSLENILHVKHMRKLDNNSQKAYVKKLGVENPKVYSQWKQWCIELDQLPDFFGTDDNPIPIDESKL